MNTETATLATVLVLVTAVVSVAAVVGTAAAQESQPETDNTVTRIEVDENGSARWTVRIRTRLETKREAKQYRAFQRQFENDTTQYLGPFSRRMRGVVADASNDTGRSMRAAGFRASTDIQQVPRRWGTVTYEFTWTNFSTVDNRTLTVGTVFDGGFLITANDTLQIVGPDSFTVERVAPAPDSRDRTMIAWNGERNFDDTRPFVVFAPTDEQSKMTDGQSWGLAGATTTQVAVSGVVVGSIGLAVVIVIRRREDDVAQGAESPDAPETERDESESAPIRTDEERVRSLLESNDGQMKQSAIVAAFDWSASKTSRLVGSMADDGEVEKLRIGRENVVTLPDDTDDSEE